MVVASVLLTSCLKDENITDRKYGLDGLEDIDLVEFTESPSKAFAINYKDGDTTFTLITVRLNSEQPATQDIQVNLTLNDLLIDDYNTANGTHFEVAPSSIYTLDNLTVTIPKGSREGTLKITTNPADLSAGEYALGLTISGVSGSGAVVSRNYSDIVVYLGVKNLFDGRYDLNITTSGWGAFGISDNQPGDYGTIALVTKSGSATSFDNQVFHSDLQPAFTAGNAGITQFGAASPVFTFDLATYKLINVDNAYPDDGRGRDFVINPAAPATDNLFDPVTKTIIANYLMKQNGRPDQVIRMVMEYVGAR